MQNTEKKMKSTIIFQFLEKNLQKFYKNPTFVTFCDNVINDEIILLMSKHIFMVKEQLYQSFWQLVKAFRFEAKKIDGGFIRPHPWSF